MKVWIDDIRKPPNKSWVMFTGHGYDFFFDCLLDDDIEEISFDHDLGHNCRITGHDIAKIIMRLAYHNKIKRVKWSIHSANSVGRRNIQREMESADIYWDRNEREVK